MNIARLLAGMGREQKREGPCNFPSAFGLCPMGSPHILLQFLLEPPGRSRSSCWEVSIILVGEGLPYQVELLSIVSENLRMELHCEMYGPTLRNHLLGPKSRWYHLNCQGCIFIFFALGSCASLIWQLASRSRQGRP